MTAVLIAAAALFAAAKKVDVFSSLVKGASEGLSISVRILPSLIVLLSCIQMLRASGLLDRLTDMLAPVFNFFGIPKETAPLVLIRPISGSGALAVATDIITTHGADSLIGRTTAIMLGSTETTFYVISVYFGAAGIKDTRYAVPAALCADFTGFVVASLTARFL